MYFDFNFTRDNAFFEHSSTVKYMHEQLLQNKQLKNIPTNILNVSVKLWAESVIKHNLDMNMTKIDHVNLLSNENSEEVISTIGAIIFKNKDERSNEDFQILRMQGIVANYLDMIVLSMKEDICGDLKKEFIEFKSLSPKVSTKPSI